MSIKWMSQAEIDFISSTDYETEFPGLMNALKEPRFTITDLGINHRDATYWDKKNILPKIQSNNTTRRKYNLTQAVWIKLIQQLRSFDISLNQIKKIKENIFHEAVSLGDLINVDDLKEIVNQLSKNSEKAEIFDSLFQNPDIIEAINASKVDFFESYILYVVVLKRDISYLIYEDGTSVPYCYDKHDIIVRETKDFASFIKKPHIVLSLSTAISQLIVNWAEKKWFEDISLVTSDEKKIIRLLRDEKTEELRIFKTNKEPSRIVQVSSNNLEAVQDFAKSIIGNGYQTMTVSTRKGKPVSFKNEVSISLKNLPE